MKSVKQLISSTLVNEACGYLDKDPMANFPKLLNWAKKIVTKEQHKKDIEMFRNIVNDPNNNWNKLIQRYFKELNKNTQKKFLINFMVNAGMVGNPIIDKNKAKYNINIPWAILMDPTSSCNLKCTGCWAAEYSKTSSMDFETLDRIIRQGKELGIYMYIYSGGEPLMRKKDLLELARIHNDCMFLSFTNATLIDEEFAEEVEKVGNMGFAISVEGFEKETDMRRGKGTYQKVMKAMDILQKHGIIFGFSTCYHSKNTEVVGSYEYIDLMVKKGCKFGWYFTYIPIGKDAVTDLIATPEQREFMYHRVREIRETRPIFAMDFWNDGEYVKGCIAGGKNYLHINANGDVEPCAFIHYSNVNIKDVSLLDALKSPLFLEYKKHQPFNTNHLRPCPMFDNPEIIRQMVHDSGAHSTQLVDEESVDDLVEKTMPAAKRWKPTADKLWEKTLKEKEEKEKKDKEEQPA
ncbi:MAG: radical SAM protein [Clostridiales bacterium]|nr:radical SAM protein [Clostridiales bacterium]